MPRVVTLPQAEADICVIFDYLYARSPQGAVAWLDAYDRAQVRLSLHADGCPLVDEYEYFDIEVRQSLFRTRRGRPYRLLFVIVDDEVRILRVRGPGQPDLTDNDL